MVGTNLDNGDLLQGLNVLANVLPQPGDAETNPLSFAILAEKLKEFLDQYTSSGTKDYKLRARLEALCLDIKAATRSQPILANLKAIKTALCFIKDVNLVDEQPGPIGGKYDNVEDELESREETDDDDDVPLGDATVDGSNEALVDTGDNDVDKVKSVKPVPGPVKATPSPRKAISAVTVSGHTKHTWNKTAAAVIVPIKIEAKPLPASQPAPRHAQGAHGPVKTGPIGETPMKSLPKDAEDYHSLPMMERAEYAQRIGIDDPALAEYAKNQPDTIKCKNCRDKHKACIVDVKLPKTACLFCKLWHTAKCTIQQDPRPKHQTELLHLKEMDTVALGRYLADGQHKRPARDKRKYGEDGDEDGDEDEDAIIEVKRSKKTFDIPTCHSPHGGAATFPKSKVSRVSGKPHKTRATSESPSVFDPTHIATLQCLETCEALLGRMADTILDLRNYIRIVVRAEQEAGRRKGYEPAWRGDSAVSAEEDIGDSDNEEMEAKLHEKHRRD